MITEIAGVVPFRLHPAASTACAGSCDMTPFIRDRVARDLKAMFKARYPAMSPSAPERPP
jgi:hypothetical protein